MSPAEQDASETHVISFATGAQSFSELRLHGELQIELELFEADVIGPECHVPCGVIPDCSTGKTMAVRAVVTLPEVSGGNEDEGYSAQLVYTRDVPAAMEELGQFF